MAPGVGQKQYSSDVVRNQVEQAAAVAEIAAEPCPQVFFTEQEAARLAEIWPPLAVYIESRLTWFVTGEEVLDSAAWDAFCAKVNELGMDEVIAIWQGAVDRFEEAMRND